MKLIHKGLLFFVVLLLNAASLKGQFSGAYAPANWGTVAVNSDGITNSAGAPTSITMVSGNNLSGSLGTNDYSITVPQSGFLTFNWSYTTNDGPTFDYPQYVVNNVATIVNGFSFAGGNSQSGSQPCVPVNQGDIFRFRMLTTDNIVGAATCVFSSFAFSTGNLTITPAAPTVCPGGTISLTASGGSNYSWSGGISNGVPFSPTATTVYTVSSGNAGCIITRTVSILYNPPLTISGPTSNICTNSTATLLAGGGITYSWSTGATAPSIVVSPSVSTTYTVVGTSTAGCNVQGVGTVTVNTAVPALTVTSSTGNGGTCPNSPVTLFGTGATSYSWSGNVLNNVPFTTTVSNVYTVTGSNACGSSTAAISVSIHPLPPVTGSANNALICSGSSVILNGGGAVTYTWTGPNGSVLNNTAFSPTSSGNYTVRGTSVLGCTASAVAGVTVLNTPSVQPVATPTSVCLGVPAVLSSIGATGYTWSPGGLSTANVIVSPLGTTTYTLVRTNGPCSFTSNLTLVINALPFANVSATPSLICAGDPVVLNVFGAITYTWLPSGFTASNFTLFPNNSISYTVIASNGSCTASGVQQVIVNPSPLVSINSSTSTVCAGGSVVLTASGNALTYTWLPGPGNGNIYTVNPTTISQYTLIGGNASNCTTQQTQLIIVNPVPPLLLNSSLPYVCTGTTALLSIANATLPGVIYSWSSNSGAGSTSNVSPTVSTTYFASAVTNSTGCSSSGSLALTVNISTFVVTSPTAICRGSSANLVASGAANSYNWLVSGVGNTPSITVSPTITTNYVVTGITGSCSSTQTVPVIVNLLPNVIATALKPLICRLENGTVTATGANSYSWNTGASTQSIIINNLTITSTFTVTGKDLNNCVKSNTVTQFVATCQSVENLNYDMNIGLSVYPNPNNGNFIVWSDVDVKIIIFNALGEQMHGTQILTGKENEITLGGLANGIYFIYFENNGRRVVQKIVIEK